MKKAGKGLFWISRSKTNPDSSKNGFIFGISLSLFAAGFLTTGKKENLLTVVAILGCLPACKSLVNTIMYFRAKECSESARREIEPLEGRLIGMYDMYFTSYQKNFAVSHMIVEGKVILGYTEDEKCDAKACTEHLQTMLKQGGVKDMTITISNQLSKYCEQLEKLNGMEQSHTPEKDDEVRVILYDISL